MRFILVFILLTSCTAAHHIRRAEHHIKKAQAKGATFGTDTSYRYIYRTDTLWNEITKEKEVIRTVIDSVPVLHHIIKYVPLTRYQERIQYKLKRDTLRLVKYITKTEAKEQKRTSPMAWWKSIIVIVGMILVTIVAFRFSK